MSKHLTIDAINPCPFWSWEKFENGRKEMIVDDVLALLSINELETSKWIVLKLNIPDDRALKSRYPLWNLFLDEKISMIENVNPKWEELFVSSRKKNVSEVIQVCTPWVEKNQIVKTMPIHFDHTVDESLRNRPIEELD